MSYLSLTPTEVRLPVSEASPRTSPSIRGFHFLALEEPAAIADHVAAWDELASNALEPNPFHEHWMVLPAIHSFAPKGRVRIVLAYADRPGPPLLCGVFPFEMQSHYKGLPIAHLRSWNHKHCFLGSPLVRREHPVECITALLQWLTTQSWDVSFIEWEHIAGDGLFHEALTRALEDSGKRLFPSYSSSRALMRPRENAEAFLAQTLSAKSRQDFRRHQRKLEKMGNLTYDFTTAEAGTGQWIVEFLHLEAAGWKGRQGTALKSDTANTQFFTHFALHAARQGRLVMMSLRLDGRPIAMQCDLVSGNAEFVFKIAYDEKFASYSPGMLLAIEQVKRFHAQSSLEWIDRCTDPDNLMANRLTLDRRTISTAVCATGRLKGKWFVSCLPGLHGASRALRRFAAGFRQIPARLF
jgi:CelD/BcsL family acetyltransferase involved in cellulose biosynthesis